MYFCDATWLVFVNKEDNNASVESFYDIRLLYVPRRICCC
jgi:hypothetical protein